MTNSKEQTAIVVKAMQNGRVNTYVVLTGQDRTGFQDWFQSRLRRLSTDIGIEFTETAQPIPAIVLDSEEQINEAIPALASFFIEREKGALKLARGQRIFREKENERIRLETERVEREEREREERERAIAALVEQKIADEHRERVARIKAAAEAEVDAELQQSKTSRRQTGSLAQTSKEHGNGRTSTRGGNSGIGRRAR